MPRIRCFYEECVFLAKGFCTAPSVEIDPEDGCLTYSEDMVSLDQRKYIDGDDVDIDFEESWDDAGFEELDGLDFDEDGDY